MSKKRYIDTKFWSDNYVTNLDPLERYLFLYLISNEHTSLCGVYEIPLRIMTFESGLDGQALSNILTRFEKDDKVVYRDGWILIKNFIKNQVLNPSVIEGIYREIEDIPPALKGLINTDCIQTGSTLGTDKLGKVKYSKVKLNKEYNEKFEKFWTEYPNKVAKKKALDSFSRIDPKLFDAIMAGLAKWKLSAQWQKDGGQFIPHPTTWLNQERWNDEVKINKSNLLRGDSTKYDKYN